jgi:integrase
MSGRQRNDGLRKRCPCPRRSWAKCAHPWHFSFKWNGEHYRFSLSHRVGRLRRGADGMWERDRATLGKPITDKTKAEAERDRLRAAIREGTIHERETPQRELLTLADLFAHFRKRYLDTERKATIDNIAYQIGVISRTELERTDGTRRPFGDWLVVDVSTDTLEQYQAVRRARGPAAVNRDLSLLRSMFNWAVRKQILERTPFKIGTEPAIRLKREPARRRRLQPGEAERLLSACGPHLRAIVEAALETGCRRGELLSLQWWQVQTEPKPQLFLPAVKTKTGADRWIPISSRLANILEMRRCAPDGTPQARDAFVFGNEIGQPAKSFKRAWERALLVAHGHQALYVRKDAGEGKKPIKTAVLTPESRAALRTIDLHFHDLRREAGSRWLEGGVPLHTVRDWLGHTSVAQTSVYLAGTLSGQHEAMRRFEESRVQRCATDSGTGAQTAAQGAIEANTNAEISSAKHH